MPALRVGELVQRPTDVLADAAILLARFHDPVPVTASSPRDYIARDDLRMEAYRRLAAVMTMTDVEDVAAEWADRYGPPPPPAAALLAVGRVRA